MKNLILIEVIIISLFACSKNEADIRSFMLDKSFELKYNKTRNNLENGIIISLDSVLNDSRCPKGAACVWAGNARVRFIYSNNTNDLKFILNTLGSLYFPKDTLIDGFRIKLIDLYPYPEIGKIIRQRDYKAELRIIQE